jgi:hypothetical protein
VVHPNTFEEVVKAEVKAIVETPENGGVAKISFFGSVEVEDFFMEGL